MNEPTLMKAMEALEPVSDKLVVAGGTAHRLFPLHKRASQLQHELLTTEDVDLVAPFELGHAGGADLLARLEKAGFQESVDGAHHNYPKHRYRLKPGVATLEFITPRRGSGTRRDGQPLDIFRFSGIVAERLPSVDILLHEPWQLPVDAVQSTRILVVNPVAFLAQKLLIYQLRDHLKQGKDVLYIYDTVSIFANSLEALRDEQQLLLAGFTRRQRKTIAIEIERFSAVTDAARQAATIASTVRANAPSALSVAQACHAGLKLLFQERE